jgi:hypothetical protein
VNTLGTALILFSTVVLAMALGVVSGYLIISGVLQAFAHKPKSQNPTAPSLVTQGVAGD